MSDSILTISGPAHEAIRDILGVEEARLFPFTFPPDGALAARVSAIRSHGNGPGGLLFVGRLAPHKNLAELLEAFALSRWHGASCRLVLAGDGSAVDRATLEETATRLKVDCRITGHVSQEELDELYATSQALVQPSLIEGYGLPILEARSCGLPVAASTSCPAAENIDNPALLFDPRDRTAMVRALDALYEIAKSTPSSGAATATAHDEAEALAVVRNQVLDALAATVNRPRPWSRRSLRLSRY